MIGLHDLAIPGRLHPTSFTLEAGQRIALVGPNGGGKTSLLRAMAGVEGASGDTRIEAECLAEAAPARRRRLVGFLPASRDIHWPIAVRDLVALGLDTPDDGRISDLLEQLELSALAHRPSDQLSTGERTRVLLARVLASRPKLLLLDEPLANLDPYWALRFIDLIDLEARLGASIVVALHDLSKLYRFDRALLVSGGHVLHDQTPDQLVANPAFEEVFRVSAEAAGVRPPADRQSSR